MDYDSPMSLWKLQSELMVFLRTTNKNDDPKYSSADCEWKLCINLPIHQVRDGFETGSDSCIGGFHLLVSIDVHSEAGAMIRTDPKPYSKFLAYAPRIADLFDCLFF